MGKIFDSCINQDLDHSSSFYDLRTKQTSKQAKAPKYRELALYTAMRGLSCQLLGISKLLLSVKKINT